jgi:hypothetical protein
MAKKAGIGDAIESFLRKEFPNLSDMSAGYPDAKAKVAMKAAVKSTTSAGAIAARNRTKAASKRAAVSRAVKYGAEGPKRRSASMKSIKKK